MDVTKLLKGIENQEHKSTTDLEEVRALVEKGWWITRVEPVQRVVMLRTSTEGVPAQLIGECDETNEPKLRCDCWFCERRRDQLDQHPHNVTESVLNGLWFSLVRNREDRVQELLAKIDELENSKLLLDGAMALAIQTTDKLEAEQKRNDRLLKEVRKDLGASREGHQQTIELHVRAKERLETVEGAFFILVEEVGKARARELLGELADKVAI